MKAESREFRKPRRSTGHKPSLRRALCERVEDRLLLSTALLRSVGAEIAAGYGLQAQYYSGATFDALATTRIDPSINFNWAAKPPVAGMAAGPFAVRWTGTFTAPRTGKYTFYTASQGGAELLIDGSPLFDRSTASGKLITRANGRLTLTAGQTYSIELDYYATGKRASMALRWAGPRIAAQVVPTLDLQSGVPQPVAPDTLTATPISAAEIDLAWSPAPGATGYLVQRSNDGVNFTTIATLDAGTTAYNDTGLPATSGFQYRAIATNLLGSSAPSTVASATTLPLGPNAPTSLMATALVGTNVNLAWADSSGDATGYMLQRSTNGGAYATIKSLPANTLSYVDTTAPEAAVLQYRVFALNGSIPSSTAPTASATTVLGAPVALSSNLAVNGVSLIWLDTSHAATAYAVQRSVNGGPFNTLTTLAASASTYFDPSVAGGNTYKYQVLATTPAAQSVPTNAVTVAPLAGVPATPANLVATPVSDTEINLTWDRVGAGETSLTVLRSTNGGAFQPLTTLPAGSNIWTDTSCYPSTPYAYELTANNANGSSPATASVAATTQASEANMPAPAITAVVASPFEIDLSWSSDPSESPDWMIERSTDGISYSVIYATGTDNHASITYADSPLTPGTTYYYRIRGLTGTGYSDYSAPVSATTAALPAGVPLPPTRVVATVNSATSTTITWTDTNGGSTPYAVEIAPYSGGGQYQWTPVAQTSPGATSMTITTAAQTTYYVRVRGIGAGGDSAYTANVIFRTASPGTGSPKVYTIGPGEEYASLGALNWSTLGPGDTVEIFPNKDASGNVIPYYEKPMISVRGTAATPINIEGMPDPATGRLPIIDGTNATSSSQWDSDYLPLEDLSLVLIGTTTEEHNSSYAWSPGFVNVSGLELRGAYAGDSYGNGNPGTTPLTYTASDGTVRGYSPGAAGIYVERGDHITISGCVIHGDNEGIFAAGQGDSRNLEDLTIQYDSIYGNGTVGSFGVHNTYVEGIDTTYQFDDYGPLRAGSGGDGLKDRGAGTIIRYCSFAGGGHLIDLDETQNYAPVELALASYHQTYVYGNTFYNSNDDPSTLPINYGGDQGVSAANRKGILYFYDNTLYNFMDQSYAVWRVELFDLTEGGESLDARNNILCFQPSTNGDNVPGIDLLSDPACAYFGTNWVSAGWNTNRPGDAFTGVAAGTGNFVTNGVNLPGFGNAAGMDFGLLPSSQCLGVQGALPANCPPVLEQYDAPGGPDAAPTAQPRRRAGLGAFGPDTSSVPADSYVGTDSGTQGSWKGVYGSQGEYIVDDSSTLPSYASVGVSGASTFVWAAGTSDVTALQQNASGTQRIASTLYSSTAFSVGLDLTDGQTHQVELYLLDYVGSNYRAETINVLDAATGAVLTSCNVADFSGGKYVIFNVTGDVVFQVVLTGGQSAVLSGLFIDPAGTL